MKHDDNLKYNTSFHAGHFLRGLLEEQGHDAAWLASRTGHDPKWVANLLEQPNMDAMLFVRMGRPLEPLFMRRVNEMVFGNEMVKPMA